MVRRKKKPGPLSEQSYILLRFKTLGQYLHCKLYYFYWNRQQGKKIIQITRLIPTKWTHPMIRGKTAKDSDFESGTLLTRDDSLECKFVFGVYLRSTNTAMMWFLPAPCSIMLHKKKSASRSRTGSKEISPSKSTQIHSTPVCVCFIAFHTLFIRAGPKICTNLIQFKTIWFRLTNLIRRIV